MTLEPWKVVTPEVFAQGCVMRVGPYLVRKAFVEVRRDAHGIVVRNPEVVAQEILATFRTGQPCGCDYGAEWVCEEHRA